MIQDHRHFSARTAYGDSDARLIAQFTPLVRKLAWHLAPSAGPAMDADDLMQVGLIALTECARRHDRPTDDGLAAYAKLRVRGAMIDAIRKLQAETRSARADWRRIEGERATLANRLGRAPTDAELAAAMELTPGELAERMARAQPVSQVELGDCYDETSGAFASEDAGADDLLLQAESREQLARAIAGLGERHQLVIQLYFLEELNLAEIASILEVSVPRVHQLKASALKMLRSIIDT